jgi:expansin
MYLTVVPVVSFFLSLAHGAALQSRSVPGEATFYGGNLHGGACLFSTYTLPSGLYGTAISDTNWVTARNCGACVQVTGPAGNSITAMVCF